ncbi:MAG TPA: hypothetical protein VM010_04200 [Chitinophagaceae bacterium]|nr:hypothetical protein [Chitinophagaceae bacterium]
MNEQDELWEEEKRGPSVFLEMVVTLFLAVVFIFFIVKFLFF